MKRSEFIRWIRNVGILVVLQGNLPAHAGSYDDFFVAIKNDNETEVAALLRRGFDANTPDPTGQCGLILAVMTPSPKVARLLIAWPKTNVEARNAKDESPLMLAALKGQDDIAAALIARGADVNKPGWAPLHYAATRGHLDVMQRLLDENAYIDAESPNGTTPLMMAALYGTPEAVKLLLEAGADASLKNSQGLTAVDFANRGSRSDSAELIRAALRGKQPKGSW